MPFIPLKLGSVNPSIFSFTVIGVSKFFLNAPYGLKLVPVKPWELPAEPGGPSALTFILN